VVSKKSTIACQRVQSQRRGLQDMSKDKPHYLPDGKLYKGDTHKVGSTLMTGAKHSASSKVLTHTPSKPKAKK
jgi:hypothetical protein